MIDGTKLKIIDSNFALQLLSSPNFEFILEVKEKTGEINQCKTAKYKNVTIRVYDSGLVLITSSLHKYKNNGEHNFDNFYLYEVFEVIGEWQKLFGFDLTTVKIENIEFGVNITPPVPTKEIIKSIVSHKREQFKQLSLPNSDYKECKHQQFIVKIYDKAKQYNQPNQILRIESKFLKMAELNSAGIYYLSDLLKPDIYVVLGRILNDTWKEVLFIDQTVCVEKLTLKQREDVKDWRNPLYWQELTGHRIKKKFNTEKVRYQKIVHEHSENIQAQISNLISEKWEKLTDNSDPFRTEKREKLTDFLNGKKTETGKINPLYNEILFPNNENRCIVTLLIFRNQRPGTKYLSEKGIKWYCENEPETYEKRLKSLLSVKWLLLHIGEPEKVFFNEIYHQIRNKGLDPKHNLKRDLLNLKNKGPKLFATIDLLPPEKLRLIKNELIEV